MVIEILTFGNMEIEKNKFYRNKTSIFLKDVNIEKVLVSKKISFGEKNYKYFIGYLHSNNKVKLLDIMLPKTSAYVKCYDGQTKWVYFLIEDDDLLEKYNAIWDKVSAVIKKEFDNHHGCNKEYLKTIIKYHGDKVTDFYDKKISKIDSSHSCLAVISLDLVFKKDVSYHPQVFLKECKYIKKKVIRHIHDSLSDFSYSSDDESGEKYMFLIDT